MVQSGPGLRARQPEHAAELARKFVSALGVEPGDINALQAEPVERLLEAQGKLGRASVFAFSPVLDEVVLPEHPGDAARTGSAADVPMIIGTNRDEASLFLLRRAHSGNGNGASLDAAGLESKLAPLGVDASRVIAAYRRARPEASSQELLVAVESDRMMRIPSIDLAQRKIAGGKSPVYMYLFRWASGPLGSAHGFEIAFVFDNVRPPVMKPSPGRQALADQMSEAWLAFARSGKPDHAGIPVWPAYSVAERATMIFDRGASTVEGDPCADERRAWEDVKLPTGMAV
jgi:para-nitrobenzyl esterase